MTKTEQRIKDLEEELNSISKEALFCPYCNNKISNSTAGYYNEAVGCKVEMYSCDCQDYPLDLSEIHIKRIPKD